MFAKLWWVTTMIVCFSLVLTLVFVGPVKAGDPYVGDGPDNALKAGDEYQPVEAGKPLWFAFCFDYNRPSKDPQVQLWSNPSTGASFLVLTPANAQFWRKNSGKIESVGAGTPNKFVKAQLFWKGDFKATGKYYVVVKHSRYPGNIPDSQRPPTYFKLAITGGGVVDCK